MSSVSFIDSRRLRVRFGAHARVLALLGVTASLAACGGGAATTQTAASDAGPTTTPTPTSTPSPTPTPTTNAPPTISGTPAASVSAGQPYSFAPSATDPEGATLKFSVTGLPSWATFSSSTGKLSGTAVAGTYANISISVSDGTNTATLPAFSITVASAASTGNGSATLAWTPPTTNTDGSTIQSLAGYRIYWGTDQQQLTNVVSIDTAGVASYTVEGLGSGTYFFSVTAVDATGVESAFSNVASKTIT